jgi:hypothetical protein
MAVFTLSQADARPPACLRSQSLFRAGSTSSHVWLGPSSPARTSLAGAVHASSSSGPFHRAMVPSVSWNVVPAGGASAFCVPK